MGGASLTPRKLRRLAEMENGPGEDEVPARRPAAGGTRVPLTLLGLDIVFRQAYPTWPSQI